MITSSADGAGPRVSQASAYGTPGVRPGPRRTRQRSAVLALLEESGAFRSAQDLYAQLREQGNPIGLATVYRALQLMVEDGDVDVLRRTGDGEAVYRRCGSGHHHHLVCRGCGRTVEIETDAVEQWSAGVAAAHGFADVDHVLEVFGTCSNCAASRASAASP